MVLLLYDSIINYYGTSPESKGFDLTDFFIKVAPALVGILALWISYINTNRTLKSKKQDEQRAEIRKKLDELYGPLLQLRMKSNLLYEKFSEGFRAVDPNFSTLTYLLAGRTFTGNDEKLLKEIIRIGKLTEDLIHAKAGLIDSTQLRTQIIPKATTHFLVLRLAYKGALVGDVSKFQDLVFPRNLDTLLEQRKSELEGLLNELNQ